MRYAKIGAGFYILWGILHLGAALEEFRLGGSLESGLVQAKINQGAWDLLSIAVASILISALLNWKNSRLGYWINLIMVSATDIGFLIFALIPGHVGVFPGILGPVFWLSAAGFCTMGIRMREK